MRLAAHLRAALKALGGAAVFLTWRKPLADKVRLVGLQVYRYLDLLVKDCYMQKVKVIEEEEERKREERGGDRIVEIDDEADEEEKHSKGLMSGEWGPAVPHHICQQTHHY